MEAVKYASICYSVDSDGEISIDVGMEDYSEDTVDKFSLLFASIPCDEFQVQAMTILQSAFERDDKGEEFERFARGVFIKSLLLTRGTERQEKSDDPLIKPTDLT